MKAIIQVTDHNKKRRTWSVANDDQNPDQKLSRTPSEVISRDTEAIEGRSQRTPSADSVERQELFVSEQPIRSLDHLVVSDITLHQIQSMLAKVEHHHFLYEQWNLKKVDPYGGRTVINLYGPPGTGKSFCAEAIAAALGKRIIRVSYAEIESKYVGDTPKNIKAAFAKAKQDDALLFFDEADSILGRRLTNVTQSADHGVNVSRSVMLIELDRFDGITIFATNLASNYDSAFVRRILGHIEMPLPNSTGRERLWRLHIPQEMDNSLQSPDDYETLSVLSEGLSGGDILNAVVTAAIIAVQRVGRERTVNLGDLTTAIAQVRKAKEDVGNSTYGASYSLTKLPIDQSPTDIQQQLRPNDNK